MEEESKCKKTKKTDLLFYICLIVTFIVFLSVFQPVRVEGSSMENTLFNGDLLLMKRDWLVEHYMQGDVVVAAKNSFRNGELIIKRIIAVEGQTVDVDNDTGTVFVDGIALEETYVSSLTYESGEIMFPITVADDCYFVLGDNRDDSLDSRYLAVGQIHSSEIKGKIMCLLFPGISEGEYNLTRIGSIK